MEKIKIGKDHRRESIALTLTLPEEMLCFLTDLAAVKYRSTEEQANYLLLNILRQAMKKHDYNL